MKRFLVISAVLLMIGWASAAGAVCTTTYHLFQIERSKNKNIVQYDICVSDNGDVPDSKAVKAYWILENGRKEELNVVQSKFAYGIKSQEKVGENRLRISVAALKDRKIVIEKTDDGYRAVMTISGKQSILERIFVDSEERTIGFPKVNYVDLFGRNIQTNVSVKERIIP